MRHAIPADDAALGELLVSAFRDTYAQKMPEVVVTERRIQELCGFDSKRMKGITWVALDESEIVGTVYIVRPFQSDSLVWLPGFCELKHLAVAPQWRGSSLSDLLMEFAWETVSDWQAKGVCVHVRRGAEGVRRFYTDRGFARDPYGDFDRLPEVFLEAHFKRVAE
jgi:GNAT superfamily N-acetyltransferase